MDENGQIREEDLKKWGLAPGQEGTVVGPGDEKVLEAMAALFELKKEGKIRAAGFSGASRLCRHSKGLSSSHSPGVHQATLSRLCFVSPASSPTSSSLSILCRATVTSPCVPCPALLPPLPRLIQRSSQLQNTTLSAFLPLFKAAGVKQIISASPLSMGLLRTAGGQPWHPASPELQEANKQAIAAVAEKGAKLEDVALGFGFASADLEEGATPTPIVVGLS